MANEVELSKLLINLRKELQAAQEDAEGSPLKFKVEDVDLELKVGATQAGEGKVGVKFWVYTADAAGKIANEAVQTIRLKLKPVTEGGGDTLISNRDRK